MDARESRRRIELVLTAKYDRDDPPYYWQPERPTLLLKNGDSRHDFPTMDNYTFKVTMETKMREYSVELCASQFNLGAGLWQAAIHNPERMEPMRYWVTFAKRGCARPRTTRNARATARATRTTPPTATSPRVDATRMDLVRLQLSHLRRGLLRRLLPAGRPAPRVFPRVSRRETQDGRMRRGDVCAPGAARHRRRRRRLRPRRVRARRVSRHERRLELRRAMRPAKEDGPEGARRLESACDPETVRGKSRSRGGAARVFGVFLLVCAVAGAATAAGAAAWRAGVFDGVRERVGRAVSGDGYRRRYDPYEDDDDFARADDFLERPL